MRQLRHGRSHAPQRVFCGDMLQTKLENHTNAAHPLDDALFIGLMSGTSLDGVDGVLACFPTQSPSNQSAVLGRGCANEPAHVPQRKIHILARASQAFSPQLRGELLALNTRGGTDELHRAALAANAIAFAYAEVVQTLLSHANVRAQDVAAIGAHGQTLRHQPGLHDGVGYTLQILNAALLAERTGIGVVADVRSRDVAAGGQGAPLVPAFHDFMFRPENAQNHQPVFILNIGGISNISILQSQQSIIGFDCGPGNALMDFWCYQNTKKYFDDKGQWAASGQVIPELLNILLSEPFLKQQPPKSTGRDLFNSKWLEEKFKQFDPNLDFHNPSAILARDIQSTITEFTAVACAQSVLNHLPAQKENAASPLLVCGGGALNDYLLARLQYICGSQVHVDTTAQAGLAVLDVEAAAFAWLAREFLANRAGNLPSVTGAKGSRILGAWHPAGIDI